MAMQAIAKQKPRFTFHIIKIVAQTNGRDAKQSTARKTNKRVKQARRWMETTL